MRAAGERLGIHYPLLSDPDSSIIRAFGILNPNIPPGHEWYGIPFPGTYIVDENGLVKAKYFEEGHRQRLTADTVLVKEFGVGGGKRVETRTGHLTLEAYAAQDVVRPGNRITLVLDVDLPRKMHIYAPGVRGYRPASFSIEESPFLWIHDPQFPEPRILHLDVIKESVPVYEGKVRVSRDITVSPRFRERRLEIAGTFEYQACDDRICYPPQRVPVRFSLEVEPHDNQRAPEPLRRKGTRQQ